MSTPIRELPVFLPRGMVLSDEATEALIQAARRAIRDGRSEIRPGDIERALAESAVRR